MYIQTGGQTYKISKIDPTLRGFEGSSELPPPPPPGQAPLYSSSILY